MSTHQMMHPGFHQMPPLPRFLPVHSWNPSLDECRHWPDSSERNPPLARQLWPDSPQKSDETHWADEPLEHAFQTDHFEPDFNDPFTHAQLPSSPLTPSPPASPSGYSSPSPTRRSTEAHHSFVERQYAARARRVSEADAANQTGRAWNRQTTVCEPFNLSQGNSRRLSNPGSPDKDFTSTALRCSPLSGPAGASPCCTPGSFSGLRNWDSEPVQAASAAGEALERSERALRKAALSAGNTRSPSTPGQRPTCTARADRTNTKPRMKANRKNARRQVSRPVWNDDCTADDAPWNDDCTATPARTRKLATTSKGAQPKKPTRWRQQSQQLRAAMRAGKAVHGPEETLYDDRIACRQCNRNFDPSRIEKHEQVCLGIAQRNKARNKHSR